MNYFYSPHTGEHIATATPADWMGATALPVPPYDKSTDSCFFESGAWVIRSSTADVLTAAKKSQITELSQACQAQIYAGFTSLALGAAHTYPANDKDQLNLSGSVLSSLLPGAAAGWTTPFWCADAAGVWSFANHTAAQIQQVGQDGKAAILAALAKNKTLADQVNAAATVAAVQTIVW